TSVPAIHRLRDCSGVALARNQVQRAPATTRCKGCSSWPDATTMLQPPARAIFAASILVTIPPEPKPDVGLPAIASISGVSSLTSGIWTAPAEAGGAV